MEKPSSESRPEGENRPEAPGGEDLVKVVDRRGHVKVIPRSEYERKKKRRRRRESAKDLPLKDILSLAFIVALILAASYIAFLLVK